MEMKELTDAFNLEIANAIKDKYPMVSEPNPDVLRIRVAITDIKQSKPGLSAVSAIIPIGLGFSVVKKGANCRGQRAVSHGPIRGYPLLYM